MNPKKQKRKDRRRARKLADQAWEAVHTANLDLAEKIIRRAVMAQEDNPLLWHDQGLILGLRHKDAEAAEAFCAALSLAPTFAEAFAHLAALRLREGLTREAVGLQTQAVKHAPENEEYAERLKDYRALAGQASGEQSDGAADQQIRLLADSPCDDWSARLSTLDWHALGDRLTRDGCVLIARVIDAESCARLRCMFEDDDLFAKTVVMDRPDFGKGVYRYFQAPIPDMVKELRRAVYPCVAPIANGWQRLLGEPESYPAEWEAFQEECRSVGQTTPTPILLKYGTGGFNALH